MDLLGWIVTGLIVGALDRRWLASRQPAVTLMLIGAAGASLAAYLGRLAALYGPGSPGAYVAALAGSVMALAIFRWFGRRPG